MGPFGRRGVGQQQGRVCGPGRGLDLLAGVLASGVLYRSREDHPDLGVGLGRV
jgi:hypothetical protein